MNKLPPYSTAKLAKYWECSERLIQMHVKLGTIQNVFYLGRMVRIPAEEVERIEQCGGLPSLGANGARTQESTENQLEDLYVPPINH